MLELDHLFIMTASGGEGGDRLLHFGLTEGTPNIHPGQGTRNRRFFFANAMLELLWVENETEVQSETIRPTHLWERWSQREQGVCPLGVCFRSPPGETLPLTTWDYCPPYLPPGLGIPMATNSHNLQEPLLFYLPFGQRPDQVSPPQRQPLEHPIGFDHLTRVEILTPHTTPPSPELQVLIELGLLQWSTGKSFQLILGFDGEKQGKQQDFSPQLPLSFLW